ncbi:MAG: right-handed parallel beta-helix repeat-containing protein [Planctomycetota bacterium]
MPQTKNPPDPRIPIPSLPFTISRSGSYYLRSDLTGIAGSHGITIAADQVTIDLNGFTLHGVPGSLDGIHVNGARRSLEVRNGCVQGFGGSGVDTFTATTTTFDGLRAHGNGAAGLRGGASHKIQRCMAEANALVGISGIESTLIEDCVALANGQTGIRAFPACSIIHCTSQNNELDGIDALGVLIGCTAKQNGRYGISTGGDTVVSDCSSTANQIGVFVGSSGPTIRNTNADANLGAGIYVGGGAATIANCYMQGNSGNGIYCNSASTISGCTALGNFANGIEAYNSLISQCAASGNTLDGIRGGGGKWTGNEVSGNFQAGLHVTSLARARLDGNNVTGNPRGIDVDSAGNMVFGNTVSANTTNFDIVAGNAVGQVVNVTGNGSFSSTNAFANLQY